jgi:hypothetical protein
VAAHVAAAAGVSRSCRDQVAFGLGSPNLLQFMSGSTLFQRRSAMGGNVSKKPKPNKTSAATLIGPAGTVLLRQRHSKAPR